MIPPPANPNAASALYQGLAGREYHEGKRALRPEAAEWVMKLRAAKLQHWVRDGDVVLELGVGAGWNLGRLRCTRRIGCDAAGFLSDRVKALGIEFVTELREVPDAAADVVLCHHTLEHLLEPAAALGQLARILKPGGRLVLHAPWERERRYARYQPEEPNHHLFNWNPQNLGNLLSVLGYRVESAGVRRYGYDRFAANLAVRLHAGEQAFRLLRAALIALRPLREVELIAAR
jgi:SAM-dependent methyltransferase